MEDELKGLSELIFKHIIGGLSDKERKPLDQWLEESEENRRWFNDLTNSELLVKELILFNKATIVQSDIWKKGIEPRLTENTTSDVRKARIWFRYAAAAIITGLIVLSFFYWFKEPDRQPVLSTTNVNDVSPGTVGAYLTLDNGQIIQLDSISNGTISKQDHVNIVKSDSSVFYVVKASEKPAAYNSITTPRGRMFSVTLSDGSKVILNAASSIRYPVQFNGIERKVEVNGEAYFMVAKDLRKPFIVQHKDVSVQVTGTSFNVNYYNPANQITLVEGSINVTDGNNKVRVVPGQQVLKQINGQLQVIQDVNLDQVTAWVHSKFYFKKTDIRNLMAEVERWYDVEVIYEGAMPEQLITGEVSRNISLANLINLLQLTNVNCRIKGKKLFVKENQ